MSSDTYDRTAIHEAGHAVIGALLGASPQSISLVPIDGTMTGGRVELRFRSAANADDIRKQITVHLAGVSAERIATGEPFQPLGGDSDFAWRLSQRLHGIEAHEDVLQAEIDDGLERAEALLRKHWPTVIRLAEASRAWFRVVDEFQCAMLEAVAENEALEIRAAAGE